MAMKENIENASIRHFKREVKQLHKMLVKRMPSLKLGHCFEHLSRLYGVKDWNVMRAQLADENNVIDIAGLKNIDDSALRLYRILMPRSQEITPQYCKECLLDIYKKRKMQDDT
jgi:hypothetical protein